MLLALDACRLHCEGLFRFERALCRLMGSFRGADFVDMNSKRALFLGSWCRECGHPLFKEAVTWEACSGAEILEGMRLVPGGDRKWKMHATICCPRNAG